MLGRASQKLSKDLYTSKAHFFSELLQNADDNTYACDASPTLSIDVREAGITLVNNEKGFTERDVRSICNLGASTKLKTQSIG